MKLKEKMYTTSSLQVFVNAGIITVDDVASLGKDKAMNKILKTVHKYAITPPEKAGGRWHTYVLKPNGKRKAVTRLNREDLENYLLDYYANVIKRSNFTFEDTFNEYIKYKELFTKCENKKKAISPSTITRWQRDFDKILKGTDFANTLIGDHTKKSIELALLELIKENELNEKYAKNLLGYISQVFEYAEQNKYIEENPFKLVDKKLLVAHTVTTYKKPDEDRVLNIFEVVSLVNAIKKHTENHPDYAPDYAVRLALLTGMRVGELVALEWGDIYDGYIHIDRMERRLDFKGKKSQLVIDEPKGLRHRKFPVTEQIQALLDEIRANISSTGYIFQADGHRCTERAISSAAARRGMECGVDKISIHRIRRTVSSELNKTLPRAVVSTLLGHDENTNKEHYDYDNMIFEEKVKGMSSMYSGTISVSM